MDICTPLVLLVHYVQANVMIVPLHAAAIGIAESMSNTDAQKTFDTNVFGPLRLSQAVFPHAVAAQKRGTFVNIGS